MKISQLIARLKTLQDTLGDEEVYLAEDQGTELVDLAVTAVYDLGDTAPSGSYLVVLPQQSHH